MITNIDKLPPLGHGSLEIKCTISITIVGKISLQSCVTCHEYLNNQQSYIRKYSKTEFDPNFDTHFNRKNGIFKILMVKGPLNQNTTFLCGKKRKYL